MQFPSDGGPPKRQSMCWSYLCETFDHLVAGTPVVVVSRQPALRCVAFPVLFDVVLTGGFER
jgi:hypothetical protein